MTLAPHQMRDVSSDRLPAHLIAIPLAAVLLTAVSISTGERLPIVGAIGAVLAVAMVRSPRVAVIGIAFLWGGAVAIPVQTVRVGPLHVTLGDLCLAAGIVGWGLQRRSQTVASPIRSAPLFALPIVVFFAAVAWGTLVAIRAGDSLGESFHTVINCAPLLAYFLIREVYTGRSSALVRDLVLVTAASCSVVLAAMAVGYEPLIGRSMNLVLTRGVDFDTVRIDPPVLRIMCVTVLLATFAKFPREGRLAHVRWALVAIMLIVEAFSLTRTTWTPMLAAWLILPVLTWGWAGVSSAVRRGAVMAVALVALLGIASAGTFGPTAQAMAVRAVSVTDSGLTKDPSLQDRLLENEAAWAQIKEHPIAGIGFPRAYGAFQYTYDAETDFTENLPKHFIHQTYLGIWLWFGVPGIVALLALIIAMVRTIAVVRSMKYRDMTVPMTIIAGLGALAFGSAFQTNLIYRPAYFAVAAGLACLDVWIGDRNMPRDEIVRETDRARPKASGVVSVG